MKRKLKAAAVSAAQVIGISLAIAVVALGALGVWWSVTYYDELVAIQKEIRALPGVTLIDSAGYEDIGLEDIWAEFRVEGQGTLMLFNLTTNAFRSVEHLAVASISGLEPRITGCDVYKTATGEPARSRFWDWSMDVGPAGPFASELRGGISSIPELIERYQEVEEFLGSWPRCPQGQRHEDTDGTIRYRSVAPVELRCFPDAPFPSIEEAGGRC